MPTELPAGAVDPIFLGELALELHMPVGELGQRMSAHELTVFWPRFFESRRKSMEQAEKEAARRAEMRKGRI